MAAQKIQESCCKECINHFGQIERLRRKTWARTRTRLTRGGAKDARKFLYSLLSTVVTVLIFLPCAPPSGHHSPAWLTGCRLPAPPCSSAPTEETLLRLLDLVDREDGDSDDDYSLLNTPSAISSLSRSSHSRTAWATLPSKGTSHVPVFATPIHMGGSLICMGRGGMGGSGGGTPCHQNKH